MFSFIGRCQYGFLGCIIFHGSAMDLRLCLSTNGMVMVIKVSFYSSVTLSICELSMAMKLGNCRVKVFVNGHKSWILSLCLKHGAVFIRLASNQPRILNCCR